MPSMGLAPATVAEAVREACRAEIAALKPGNVSIHSAGHGMTAADFLSSADLIAPAVSQAGLTVGERIELSVERTVERVGCNTNLGIVLLVAPLAHAALLREERGGLAVRLHRVLRGLTVGDAVAAYRAIRRASPGGLGRSRTEDVAGEPSCTLLEAMRIAAARDRIAWQYANDYGDIFGIGLPALREAERRWAERQWATVACYLRFLAAFPDTHIERKYGAPAAEEVRRAGMAVETDFKACENPRTAVAMLLSFDEKLKRGGLNPGTSADLTVATLVAGRLEDLLVRTS